MELAAQAGRLVRADARADIRRVIDLLDRLEDYAGASGFPGLLPRPLELVGSLADEAVDRVEAYLRGESEYRTTRQGVLKRVERAVREYDEWLEHEARRAEESNDERSSQSEEAAGPTSS